MTPALARASGYHGTITSGHKRIHAPRGIAGSLALGFRLVCATPGDQGVGPLGSFVGALSAQTHDGAPGSVNAPQGTKKNGGYVCVLVPCGPLGPAGGT